jgi:hypothetical protein
MDGPKRYLIKHVQPNEDCGCRVFPNEHENGTFVTHADYAELESLFNQLIGEYEEMIQTQAADLSRLTKELHAEKSKSLVKKITGL